MDPQARLSDELAKATLGVRDCIKQSIRDLLGEKGAQAIFFHLRLSEDYEVTTNEFHARLVAIFQSGAPTLEKAIIKELYRRLDIPLNGSMSEFDYKKSVEHATEVSRERVVKAWTALGSSHKII